MLKKSRIIAALTVCIMMFAVVEPALAWWGEDTAYGGAVGGVTGGFWGGVIGAAIAGAAVIATGGLAAIPLAGAAIGGAALTGATYGAAGGAVTGAVVGAVTDKETVNKTAVIASVAAPVVATGYIAAPYVAAAIGSSCAAVAGKEFLKSAVDDFKKQPIKYAMNAAEGIGKIGGVVYGVASVPELVSKFNSHKLEKKIQQLENLAKDGKKVTVMEVKQITPSRLAIKYSVNGVEYSETFENK